MRPLEEEEKIEEHRLELMQFLNAYDLEAPAILNMVRHTEPIVYDMDEHILVQGRKNQHIFFLMSGNINIKIDHDNQSTHLGERGPVTLLGEISYFNDTPATAHVYVATPGGAVVLQLSYDYFDEVIKEYKDVKSTLARIGEMRMISQYNGNCSFRFFMDMIGWKRDRLAINRAASPHLEEVITQVLLPQVKPGQKILDAGDGPGVVSEIINELESDRLDDLFLQARHLEDAILNPVQAYPSDLTRTQYLNDQYHALVALQVFHHVEEEQVPDHFKRAHRIIEPGGFLLVLQLRVVEIDMKKNRTEIRMLFNDLENLVNQVWPAALKGEPLVKVTFVDADFDPMMDWNENFSEAAVANQYKIPEGLNENEQSLLQLLLKQVNQSIFYPDEFYSHWLIRQGSQNGFKLESSEVEPDMGFYYQLYRRV